MNRSSCDSFAIVLRTSSLLATKEANQAREGQTITRTVEELEAEADSMYSLSRMIQHLASLIDWQAVGDVRPEPDQGWTRDELIAAAGITNEEFDDVCERAGVPA